MIGGTLASAEWLSGLSRFAIVEWVPPDDEQVCKLTAGRTESGHLYLEQNSIAPATSTSSVGKAIR